MEDQQRTARSRYNRSDTIECEVERQRLFLSEQSHYSEKSTREIHCFIRPSDEEDYLLSTFEGLHHFHRRMQKVSFHQIR